MKKGKFLATVLAFSFLTCNISLAQPNYQLYYNNTNCTTGAQPYYSNYNYVQTNTQPYYNNYAPAQQTYVETTVIKKESFADEHPVLTTLGIGLLAAGVITGVALSDDRHDHHPDKKNDHKKNDRHDYRRG